MAAPPPYWKRKTRPCPFYSQGRCLFADSCNFIHSAKFANEIAPSHHELASGSALSSGTVGPFDDCLAHLPGDSHISYGVFTTSERQTQPQDTSRPSSQNSERKRRSVRSPPRSPRLSGLLFALQSVIGPDVEEEEVDDVGEDGIGIGDENPATLPENPSTSVLPSYYSSPFVEADSVSLEEPSGKLHVQRSDMNPPQFDIQEASESELEPSQDLMVPLTSPFDSSFNLTSEGAGFSMLSDFPEPPNSLPALDSEPLTSTPKRSPTHRVRIPSPIVTQHSPINEAVVFEDNTFEIRSQLEDPLTPARTRPHSTLDLLSSPFTSPAKRALSLQFMSKEPHSPIFDILSGNTSSIRRSRVYDDDDLESLETLKSPTDSQSNNMERRSEGGSSTDNTQTPKTAPRQGRDADAEIEEIPPLPETSVRPIQGPNGTLKDDEVDFTITAVSRVDALSYVDSSGDSSDSSSWGIFGEAIDTKKEYDDVSCEGESVDLNISRSPARPTIRPESWHPLQNLTPLVTSEREQPSSPSPRSANFPSSNTSETLVNSPISPTEIRKSARKRLDHRSFTSPIKILRDSSCPPSLVNTIRPEPSPLTEDYPARSVSSMSTSSRSSQKTTWDEVSASGSQKVSFGFRRSHAAIENHSSSKCPQTRQLPRSKRRPCDPRPPSLSISTKHPSHSQVDSLHSIPPQTHPIPRSASDSASSAGPSWMRPLRLSIAVSTASSSRNSQFSFSPAHFDRFSSVSARSSISIVSNQSLVDNQLPSSSRTSLLSTYADQDIPQNEASPSLSRHDDQNDMPAMPTEESTVFYYEPRLTLESMSDISDASYLRSDISQTSDPPPCESERHFPNPQLDVDEDATITRRGISTPPTSQTHIGEEMRSIRQQFISSYSPPSHDSVFIRDAQSMQTSPNSQPSANHEKVERASVELPVGSRGALDLDLLSPLSGSMRGFDLEEFDDMASPCDSTRKAPTSFIHHTSRRESNRVSLMSTLSSVHAIATPKPTLLFAIARDDVTEVERVLASGEVQPNDDVGPQSALEFALRNDQLTQKTEIVKALLAYGADPSTLPSELRVLQSSLPNNADVGHDEQAEEGKHNSMNPAMRYYLNRATAPQSVQTSSIRRSFFQPLTRIRYDLIGQDRALEHLYWVLSLHSKQAMANPLVVLCCGPSGHGKSFLARKFGNLLGIPTHTVNMTVLQSSHDLWQCPSMSPYDSPSEKTLSDFLIENQGKRCVVVLDEIDKNEDERNLWSLLAPWESGRCSFDSGRRHIDVRNVIWLGTSNTGQDIIFNYHDSRVDQDKPFSREEYRELMALLRPSVSEKLGASLLSRVTTVLPFVPFTSEERLAIASEALLSLGGDFARDLSLSEFEKVAARSLVDYVSSEGARSLYRNVSTHLMEVV